MAAVRAGARPPVPAGTAHDWAQLMTACWAYDPADRPGFPVIVRCLANMLAAERHSAAAAATATATRPGSSVEITIGAGPKKCGTGAGPKRRRRKSAKPKAGQA